MNPSLFCTITRYLNYTVSWLAYSLGRRLHIDLYQAQKHAVKFSTSRSDAKQYMKTTSLHYRKLAVRNPLVLSNDTILTPASYTIVWVNRSAHVYIVISASWARGASNVISTTRTPRRAQQASVFCRHSSSLELASHRQGRIYPTGGPAPRRCRGPPSFFSDLTLSSTFVSPSPARLPLPS